MNNQILLKVKNLEKSYKGVRVIKGIDFEVNKGEILCFLGPNGAGKSTTINILTAALSFDKGEITYNDKNLNKNKMYFKQRLGIVPQDLAIYEDISAEKNVQFFASLYGLKGKKLSEKTLEALDFVGLKERKDDNPKTFSGGMKRRLNIACAIAHRPELLIMDEPAVGIDPQSRNHILNSIKRLRDEGMTILYTTHYMEEVEEISTRIIILDDGRIIASGNKEKLKEGIETERQFIIDVQNVSKLNLDEIFKIEGIKDVKVEGSNIEITSLKTIENLDLIITALVRASVKINSISCKAASLETVFLKLTGKNLRD